MEALPLSLRQRALLRGQLARVTAQAKATSNKLLWSSNPDDHSKNKNNDSNKDIDKDPKNKTQRKALSHQERLAALSRRLRGGNEPLLNSSPEGCGSVLLTILEPFLQILQSRHLVTSPGLAVVTLDAISRLLRGGVVNICESDTQKEGKSALSNDGASDLEEAGRIAIRSVFQTALNCCFADLSVGREEVAALHCLKVCHGCLASPIFGPLVDESEVVEFFDCALRMLQFRPTSDLFQDAVADQLRSWLRYVLLRRSEGSRERGQTPIAHELHIARSCALLERIGAVIAADRMKPPTQSMPDQLSAEEDDGSGGGTTSPVSYLVAVELLGTFMEAYSHNLDSLPDRVLSLIADNLCLRLIAGLETHHLEAFAVTLRALLSIYATPLRRRLKYQLELFFRALLLRVLENSATPQANRDVALEALVELSANSDFTAELWVNFDCSPSAFDVLEHLCRYLYRNAFPAMPVSGAAQPSSGDEDRSAYPSATHSQSLCLEGLLLTLQNVQLQQHKYFALQGHSSKKEDSVSDGSQSVSASTALELRISETTPVAQLRSLKGAKTLLQGGFQRFANESPEAGLRYLVAEGLLPAVSEQDEDHLVGLSAGMPDPTSAALLLHAHNALVDKKALGMFFGNRAAYPQAVFSEFIRVFITASDGSVQRRDVTVSGDVSHQQIARDFMVTLRAFLESFRLPGEAPIISRIFERFSEVYWEAHVARVQAESQQFRPLFQTADVVYVLCYSILMLNVDLHNKAVKVKMTVADFIKRTNDTVISQEGVVDPLAESILIQVFDSVFHEEITLPDDRLPSSQGSGPETASAHMSLARVSSWHSLVRRSQAEPFVCDVAPSLMQACAQDVFGVVWRPSIAALSVILERAVAIDSRTPSAEVYDLQDYDDSQARVLESALQGLRVICAIAAGYGLYEPVDSVIIVLCTHSGLPSLTAAPSASLDHDTSGGHTSKRRRIAIWAKNRSHIFTSQCLLQVVAQFSPWMRNSWRNFLQCAVILAADSPHLSVSKGSVFKPPAGSTSPAFLRDYAAGDVIACDLVSMCTGIQRKTIDQFVRAVMQQSITDDYHIIGDKGSNSSNNSARDATRSWGSWLTSIFSQEEPPSSSRSAPPVPASVARGSPAVVHSVPLSSPGLMRSLEDVLAPSFPDDRSSEDFPENSFWDDSLRILHTDIVVGDEVKLARTVCLHLCHAPERILASFENLSPDSLASLLRAATMYAGSLRASQTKFEIAHVRREMFLFEAVSFAIASNSRRALYLWIFVREYMSFFLKWLSSVVSTQRKTSRINDLRPALRRTVSILFGVVDCVIKTAQHDSGLTSHDAISLTATLSLLTTLDPLCLDPDLQNDLACALLRFVRRNARILNRTGSPTAMQTIFQLLSPTIVGSSTAERHIQDVTPLMVKYAALRFIVSCRDRAIDINPETTSENLVASGEILTLDLVPFVLDCAASFVHTPQHVADTDDNSTTAEVAVSALILIGRVFNSAEGLGALSEGDSESLARVWSICWHPALVELSHAMKDSRNSVRTAAGDQLEYHLLESEIFWRHVAVDASSQSYVGEGRALYGLFRGVLLPLMADLMAEDADEAANIHRPQGLDPVATAQLRKRVSAMVCAVLLRSLTLFSQLHAIGGTSDDGAGVTSPTQDFASLWLQVLQMLSRYMKSETDVNNRDEMLERFKNVLNVAVQISASTLPPLIEHDVWDLSWQTVRTFAPNLQNVIEVPAPFSPPV